MLLCCCEDAGFRPRFFVFFHRSIDRWSIIQQSFVPMVSRWAFRLKSTAIAHREPTKDRTRTWKVDSPATSQVNSLRYTLRIVTTCAKRFTPTFPAKYSSVSLSYTVESWKENCRNNFGFPLDSPKSFAHKGLGRAGRPPPPQLLWYQQLTTIL